MFRSINGTLRSQEKLVGTVHVKDTITENKETYSGDYVIKPSINRQTLETADKTMEKDLVIQAIPYAEVTNSANGITVTIGGV